MSCLSIFQATVAKRDLSRGAPKNHRRDSGAYVLPSPPPGSFCAWQAADHASRAQRLRRTRAGRQRDRKEGEQDWQQEDVWPKPCGSHLTRQGVKQGMLGDERVGGQ